MTKSGFSIAGKNMPIIQVAGASLHYAEVGCGETLVFLHGYTGSSQDWLPQLPITWDNYHNIAIDHRGHGRSSAPADAAEYSIKVCAEDVYQLLLNRGITRYCLIGHSMGGFVALQLALDHPQGLRGLVLVDTSSGQWDVAAGYKDYKLKLHEIARMQGLAAAFEYDAQTNPVKVESFKRVPALKESARQKVLQTSLSGYIHVSDSFSAWPPVTDRLGEIRVPTLIVRGEYDHAFAHASDILNAGIANSKMVIIDNAGHNPHEENSDVFNQVLVDFLPCIQW